MPLHCCICFSSLCTHLILSNPTKQNMAACSVVDRADGRLSDVDRRSISESLTRVRQSLDHLATFEAQARIASRPFHAAFIHACLPKGYRKYKRHGNWIKRMLSSGPHGKPRPPPRQKHRKQKWIKQLRLRQSLKE